MIYYTCTILSWGRSPDFSAGESSSTALMYWPGLNFSVCRLKPYPVAPFFMWHRRGRSSLWESCTEMTDKSKNYEKNRKIWNVCDLLIHFVIIIYIFKSAFGLKVSARQWWYIHFWTNDSFVTRNQNVKQKIQTYYMDASFLKELATINITQI